MVFAAAGLKNALDEIAASFEKTESHSVVFNFAGSSQLAHQVIADAPANLLITANTLWMDEVEKARSIQPDSRFNVTSNQLVLASNQRQIIQLNPENLHESLSGKRIAMALVDAVPDVILADEPLSSLDTDRKAEILPYFEMLRDQLNIPIVYVSHDADEVARLATTHLLDHGKIIAP